MDPGERLHHERRRHPLVHRRAEPERYVGSDSQVSECGELVLTGGSDGSFSGSITMEDLIAVLPFGGTFDLVQLDGSTLRKVFEHSVQRYGTNPGEFLQVSGTCTVLRGSKRTGAASGPAGAFGL